MKYIPYILVFFIWIFANGIWEMAKAPEHYSSCQQIEWAQEQNRNKFRPDEALALWILKSLKCNESSYSETKNDMGSSRMAMAYICWNIANDAGHEDDSDLFAKMISMARKIPDLNGDQHSELMGYAAKEVLNMDVEERKSMYKYGCMEPLKNIKRASEQGMLD
mgnify:CR=1 FL=1